MAEVALRLQIRHGNARELSRSTRSGGGIATDAPSEACGTPRCQSIFGQGPGTRTEREIDVHALVNLRPRGLIIALGVLVALGGTAAHAADARPGLQLSPSLGSAGNAAAPQLVPAVLNAPIPGARVTSPFGWRIHPILKVRRFHKGVDYGAPVGTPVHAAGDGVIESMGREHRFGWVLRIRHNGEVETAYSHLARFSPGLKVGSEVSTGDVIGTVGHSGWATGPHLDYEVIVDGRSVDPDSLRSNPPLHLLPADRLLAPVPAAQLAFSQHDNSTLGAP